MAWYRAHRPRPLQPLRTLQRERCGGAPHLRHRAGRASRGLAPVGSDRAVPSAGRLAAGDAGPAEPAGVGRRRPGRAAADHARHRDAVLGAGLATLAPENLARREYPQETFITARIARPALHQKTRLAFTTQRLAGLAVRVVGRLGLVDQHSSGFGVEPICRVLEIAPSAYRRYAARQRDPHPAAVEQDRLSWAQGARDAFHGKPPRERVTDPLAYAAGRVEGEAWRSQGRDLRVELCRNRLPYPVGDQAQVRNRAVK